MMKIEVMEAQRQEVEALLRRRDLAPRQRERLEMVKAMGLGQDEATIARWSGRGVRTVRRWLARFAEGGATALTDAPRPGRPPEADAAYLTALDAVVETAPSTLGLPFDVWTSPRLSAYLAQERGVRIAPSWASRPIFSMIQQCEGLLLCLGAAASFNTTGIFAKLIYKAHASVSMALSVRMALTALILWALIVRTRQSRRIHDGRSI